MKTVLRVFVFVGLFITVLYSAHATPLPEFKNEDVLPMNQPMALTFLPDGRMLALQKTGEMLLVDLTTEPAEATPYMTLENIDFDGERGLIDITLHPDFEQNGFFYLYYSPANPPRFRVSRFTHEGNSSDVSREFVVWEDHEDYVSCCHYGGGLDFGPDGLLYVTMGDEFVAFQGHDLRHTAGSVLRLYPEGGYPADNPFLHIDHAQPEIWIRGLRNPFRARWDWDEGNEETARFFIGDVGGNNQETAHEEIHVAFLDSGGDHFGWPWCEGAAPNPDFPACDPALYTDPIFSYPHLGNGGSVTGGVVYRGTVFPEAYQGAYFYGDYTHQYIRYLTFDSTGLQVTGTYEFDSAAGLVVFIEEGPDGALYYADISGRIRRIVYIDQSPVPTCEAAPLAGLAPLSVTVTCVTEDDQEDPLSLRFLWGDGSEDSVESVLPGDVVSRSHTYTQKGITDFRLEAADVVGNRGLSNPLSIAVGAPPVCTIIEPQEGDIFRARDLITYSGSAEDPDGSGEDLTYSWFVGFRHNEHIHPAHGPHGGTEGSFEVPYDKHDFRDATSFEITFTVTDSDGLSCNQTVSIFPDKVDLTLATEPPGLELQLDDVPVVAPFVVDTLIGFEHSVSARPQCLDGEQYVFDSWSDGGSASHTITVPSTDFSPTATFHAVGQCFPNDGLVLHLNAADGVVTGAEEVVQEWNDQSFSGNHLYPTSDAPRRTLDTPSGRPAIRFDGVNDSLGRDDFLGLPVGNEDRTVLMVVSYGSDGSGGFTWGTASPNQVFGAGVNRGTGRLLVQGWGSANDFQAQEVGQDAGWLRHTVVTQGGSFSHYKDGLLIDSGSHTWDTGTSKVRLGVEIDNSPKIAMDVAEILVYDRALSETERQQVENYFEQQYFPPPAPAPIARDDAGSVPRGGTVDLDILHNDEDPDGDGHLHGEDVRIVTSPDHGSVDVDLDSGAVTYTHDGSLTTSDRFTYRVADHDGFESNEATVCIEVLADDFPLLGGRVLHLESGGDCGVEPNPQGTVDQWFDISGHGNDLSTLGTPNVAPGTPGGPQFLELDGQNDAFVRDEPLHDLPGGSEDRTMLAVVRYHSSRFGGITYGAPGPCDSLGNRVFGLAVNGAGNLAIQGWCPSNDFSTETPGNGADWLLQSVVLHEDQLQHFAGGTLIDQADHTFATEIAHGSLMLGAEIDRNPFLRMDVAAVLLYDRALTPLERTEVETYLANKYLDEPPPPIQPPKAMDDLISIAPGECVIVDVLANDVDFDGVLNPSTVMIEDHPNEGFIQNVDPVLGTITYCHNLGSTATTDSFTYTVADEVGLRSAPATVRVLIGEPLPVTTGLVLHLESDLGVSTFGASQVTGWLDLSGMGHDVAEAAGDPVLSAGVTPSGRDAVRFDGQGDRLKRSGPLALPSGGAERTMFVVADYHSTGFGGVSYGRPATSCAVDPNRVFGLVVDNRGDLTVQGWCLGFDFATDTRGTGEGWLVHSAVVERDTLAQYRDGGLIGSWLHTFDTDSSGDLVIGVEIDGRPFVDMDIAAVLLYDRALTPAERQDVEEYLQQKYLLENTAN